MKLTYSAICLCCLIVLGALAADLHSTPTGHWPTSATTSISPASPDMRAAKADDKQDDQSGDDDRDDEQGEDNAENESESDAPDDDADRLTLREEDLDLEKLFPERSFFGPAARSFEFSHDGRYGAYLYRPHKERRHGNDLWLYDTDTGEATRITMATVMAKFQESARDVVKDRKKQAEEAGKLDDDSDEQDDSESDDEQTDAGDQNGDTTSDDEEEDKDTEQDEQNDEQRDDDEDGDREEERNWGNWVSDDDHERRDAPRYSGISTYTWSPTDRELLFVSEGDVYRLNLAGEKPSADPEIERMTRTNDALRNVQYWPDGTGFTYMRNGSLMRVQFDSHLIMQLDPQLPRGESMSGYRVSPDGTRMVFLTSRTIPGTGASRTVTIVNYRDRFARTRQIRRTVSDDPQRESEVKIYLFEMSDAYNEESQLAEVYKYRSTRPRDVHHVPRWSPDSTRVAFSRFEQTTGHVSIYEASLTHEKADDDDADKPDEGDGTGDGDATDDSNGQEVADDTEEAPVHDIEIRDAEEIYRFLHYGGPNTPRLIDPYYLSDSHRLVFLTEQSGYRHLHRLDPTYQALDQLTSGRFEVYPFGISDDHTWIFATATAEHLAREDVYRINIETGEMQRLSTLDGRHINPAVCPDGEHVLSNFVAYGRLRELIAFNSSDDEPTTLTDSHPDEARRLTSPEPELFSYTNRHGQDIHGMMFKPDDWREDDQRPLLIYVYGGPLSSNNKQVRDGSYGAANYFFAYYMAKKHGYVTVTIDPRGTSGYGGMFEKANFERVGKPQTEDLVDGVKWLVENHGVDENRVGIHGWSFGGFQTQMCMYTEPDVFQVGIAGAGPTEWHNYNSWYSTGTIDHNPDGETDLEEYSLIPLAENLEGKLLLVHGMEDSNVLYQDTVKVYAALLEAGKETNVELFLDPTGGHGLGGHVKRLNRYRKYEDFLLQHLGAGEPNESDDADESEQPEDADEPVTVDAQTDDEDEEEEQADRETSDAP